MKRRTVPYLPGNSRLWPLNYQHPPETRLSCRFCWAHPRRNEMREMMMVEMWRTSATSAGGILDEPIRVLACGEGASPECLAMQKRYCR